MIPQGYHISLEDYPKDPQPGSGLVGALVVGALVIAAGQDRQGTPGPADILKAATILRHWYVLGPGYRWPYLLLSIYRVLEALPATRERARRLGLVTLDQMVAALVRAVENPAQGVKVVEVPEVRDSRLNLAEP